VILVDTSVWSQHFNREIAELSSLLETKQALIHPFVIGELAMANLSRRGTVMLGLRDLPHATVAQDHEVLRLVEQHRLFGRGIGYIDAHLLAATRLSSDAFLWSFDQRLIAAALQLKIAWL
jgi:predicted nucleic acid-binding protein